MSLKVTVLGCGNSTGVPALGNYWGKCDPAEPKNNRTRSSILVQSSSAALVVDTGPDFRMQLNRTDCTYLDAVLYTHAHSDHVQGIDELRILKIRSGQEIPIYGDAATIKDLKHRFDYLFSGGATAIYPPILSPNVFKAADFGRVQTVAGIEFTPFLQDHGTCESVGYRFGNFGYSVDFLNLSDDAVDALRGIETWLVDCTGYGQTNNPVHANLEKVIALNERIGAKSVWLTSLTLGADYQTLKRDLPDGYAPAFDGLVLDAA